MPDQRVGIFPPGVHRWSDQAVASTSSSLHSSTRRAFWTQGFSYVWYLYRRTLWQSYVCTIACSGHYCFEGDLTKPAITIASVDRFYLNLVVCLQLDITLLIQNCVKIWHYLPELWQCIQGFTFSWTQCSLCEWMSVHSRNILAISVLLRLEWLLYLCSCMYHSVQCVCIMHMHNVYA